MIKDTGWRHRLEARKATSPRAPRPSDEQIAAVIESHGLQASLTEVGDLPAIGTVNTVLALGERYVLRVPAPHGVGDTQTESVAAPTAFAAGVATPQLIVYDDTLKIFDVPFTVFERVAGVNFGLMDLNTSRSADIFRAIGTQLALLHQRVDGCVDPSGYLKEPGRPDPSDMLEHLRDTVNLSQHNSRWLTKVFDRLRPAVEDAVQYKRFLHNDVLPTNVIVSGNAFAALIDWNDSGWGDPALEFAAIPTRCIPFVLQGYREIAIIDGESTVWHRILWDQLSAALEFCMTVTDEGNISWARPPFARMIELLAGSAQVAALQSLLE